MPTVGEMDAQDFARMNADALRSVLGNRTGDTGGGFGSSGQQLGDGLGGAINAAGKFATGQYAAADATQQATAMLNRIPVAGGIISNAFSTVGNTALTMNQALNDAGQSGGNFGNRLGEAAEAVLGARMSFSEYTETIRKNATTITAFGGTVNDGARTLLALDKGVQETNIARTLVEAGVSQKEINDATLVYYNRAIGINRLDEAGKLQAAESAARFSEELDKNARLFGKSRAEQQKDIQAQQDKAAVQAYYLQQDLKGRQAFSDMQAAVSPMGPKFMDMATEITLYGQVRSQDSRLLQSALGQAGIDFQNAVLEQKNARTDEEKKLANEHMATARQAVDARMATKEFTNQAMQAGVTNSKSAQVFSEAIAGSRTLLADRAAFEQAAEEVRQGKLKAGDDAAFQLRVKQINDEKAAKAKDELAGAAGGKKDPAAAVGRTLNDVNGTLKDFSAGFGKTLNATSLKVGKEISDAGSQLASAIRNALHPRTADEANRVFDINKIVPGSASPAARGDYNPANPPKKLASGTMGSFGDFFHDFGAESIDTFKLHGKEMVLPENQLPQFMQQFTSQMKDKIPNPQDMMKQMQGGMQVPSEISNMVKSSAASAQTMNTMPSNSGSVTLDVLHDDLQRLNKSIEQMVAHTETLKDNSGRQVKATRAMAGNKLA